jgi:hypothetical protein
MVMTLEVDFRIIEAPLLCALKLRHKHEEFVEV